MTGKTERLIASMAPMRATNHSIAAQIIFRGQSMKNFFCFILALAAASTPALAITVQTPANGAQVTSPFSLTASTSVCDSKPAVSMGYSLDHGGTTIVTTNFTVQVTAPAGTHILHVKCWGKKVHEDQLLNITVLSSTTPPPATAATPVLSPAPGRFSSSQSVTLSTTTTGATIYYTIDGSAPSTSSPQYEGPIAVDQTTTIEAIAAAPGDANSGLARGDYVIGQSTGSGPQIPASAIAISQIQTQENWKVNHDPATPGSSDGSMTLVSDPSLSGSAAQFDTTFQNAGGEIYSKSYGNDPNALNFLYDGYIWINSGSTIGNLELDNNQVAANGDTIIYAFQCAGDSNTWDYSANTGTAKNPHVHWLHSSQPCNPQSWTQDTWHHVQISYSRDTTGNITYNSVWLDGTEYPINETVFGAFNLGWSHGDLMTNFQVDGHGKSGSSTLYLDNLTFYRW
jgi:hypothetical protein